MADLNTSKGGSLIAQANKDPGLPARPEPDDSKGLKEWSAKKVDSDWILSSAEKISKAKSAILRLEFDQGSSQQKANEAMNQLLGCISASRDLLKNLSGDETRAAPALRDFQNEIAGTLNAWAEYKPGTAFTLNPFNKEAGERTFKLGKMHGCLRRAGEALEKLRPYLEQWSTRPSPKLAVPIRRPGWNIA